MLCKPNLDMFDTMNCFEVLDPKMDTRMHRKLALTQAKARQNGILIDAQELSDAQKRALMQELVVQFATWQDQAPLLQ